MKPVTTRTGVVIGGAYVPPRDHSQAEHHRRVRGLSAHACPSAQPPELVESSLADLVAVLVFVASLSLAIFYL